MKQTKVAANLQQDFSEQEKNQARINIGAAASAALNYEILRAENAEAAAKSEVLAGTGISVTNTLAQDGHSIYTVSNSGDSLYKRLQNSIDQPYADYAFIRNLRQTPNGEVSIECSYISAATDTVTGLMSSSDKLKLDGIQAGAQVNQNAWSNLQVGNTLIQADSATDTLTVSAGNNITLTPDASNDSLMISATDTRYSAGTGLTLSGTEFSVDTTAIQEKLTAGSNITITGTTISATDTDTHRPIQVNGTQNLGDNTTPLNLKAGSNVTLTANGGDVTIAAASSPSQVNADWTSSSGVSQILHKPTIAKKPYGGSETELTSLVINADDPDGYTDVMCDNASYGKLIAGPYATLLNSGVNGVGDSATPVYINSSGQFDTCSGLPTVEYISFNYSNETTAQDAVYTAVAAAYTAGKLPVLYCGVANATLYWFPTANGANGYSFSRTVSNYSYVVTIDATSHVISHQSKEIINYTAGTNVSIDANNQISATDTTYSAGSYIDINANNVISNTMHVDTTGLMVSYNTLANAGTTTHSWGPWRIQITKKAMVAWDTNTASIEIRFAHSDYLDGSITNGAALIEPIYMWKDGNWDDVYTGHTRWSFTGAYDSGPSNGYTIFLDGPTDSDGNNRSMPKKLRGYHFNISCGINSPDWLECKVYPMYINNNTSVQSNGARLLIQAKYFYV